MIIDAHTHLFGRWLNLRGIRPRDFVRTMDETGIDKACVFTLEGFFDLRDGIYLQRRARILARRAEERA